MPIRLHKFLPVIFWQQSAFVEGSQILASVFIVDSRYKVVTLGLLISLTMKKFLLEPARSSLIIAWIGWSMVRNEDLGCGNVYPQLTTWY